MAEKVKKAKRKKQGPRYVSRVEFLRMQLAAAESNFKQAKEHFSRAKRRRKLAKLLARRAKTDLKQAKAQLANTREALATAESTEVRVPRVVRRPVRKPRAAVKAISAPKRISKGVRLIRPPQVAEPSPAPPVLAVVREVDEQPPQPGPAAPSASPGQN